MKAIERIISEIKTKIMETVESGDLSEASTKQWLPSLPMPVNAITGRPYASLLNALNLVFTANSKEFISNRWLTFKQAKEKGISVRKGEKGSVVVGWFKAKPKTDNPKERISLYPKCFTVFNEEQLTELLPGHNIGPAVLLEATAAIKTVGEVFDQIGVTRIEDPNQNYYSPRLDQVAITPISHFINEGAAIGTILHELSHASGHSSRLDRGIEIPVNMKTPEGLRSYGIEEGVAECTSWLVSMYLGFPHQPSHSSAYVVVWLGKNIGELDNVLLEAQKSSKFLINAFDKVMQEQEQEFDEVMESNVS
jgi:antirestriction protein ArdC